MTVRFKNYQRIPSRYYPIQDSRTYPQELDVKANHRPNCAQNDHVSQYTGVLALDVARFPCAGMHRYRALRNLCAINSNGNEMHSTRRLMRTWDAPLARTSKFLNKDRTGCSENANSKNVMYTCWWIWVVTRDVCIWCSFARVSPLTGRTAHGERWFRRSVFSVGTKKKFWAKAKEFQQANCIRTCMGVSCCLICMLLIYFFSINKLYGIPITQRFFMLPISIYRACIVKY